MTEQEIARLKAELEELREFRDDVKRQEEERIITEEQLEFSWAGNLGRWSWHYPSGRVVFNPRKVEVLGYDYESFHPMVDSFTSLIHPDDYAKTMGVMKDHLTGAIPVYEVEYRMRCNDGSWRWFYDRGKVTERDEKGAPVTITGIVFDVTAEKDRQQALEEANRKLKEAIAVKNHFFSIIAHDLRSPISSFINFIRVMQDDTFRLQGEEFRTIILQLEDLVKNTDTLLENLLTWARSQSGGIEAVPRRLNLAATAVQATSPLQALASEKKVEIELETPESINIWADGEMVETVIRNLVSNAIKFSPKESRVKVEAIADDNLATIKVSDQGVGMDPARLTRLFEISGSFSTPGTENERGHGLGLQICHEFVEKNGGKLSVESSEGRGSTFSFTIPISSAER